MMEIWKDKQTEPNGRLLVIAAVALSVSKSNGFDTTIELQCTVRYCVQA